MKKIYLQFYLLSLKMRVILIMLLMNSLVLINSNAQTIPLVYSTEFTGDTFPKPPIHTRSELPAINPLPDPFAWANGSGRSTKFSDWSHRRAEIATQIEQYEIGIKPPRPDSITASYSKGTLTVNITKNGQTIKLTSTIALPVGTGPFPAVIGMNSPSGSVPSSIFSSNNVATITYVHDQVTSYSGKSSSDQFFKLYPNLYSNGQYSIWAWGVSRIIDGLELVKDSLPIDLKHLAVTGCSYAGKMALFAGALDERIALTIAQESGGGGAAAWRVSNTLGNVETLSNTNSNWFMGSMFQFGNDFTANLPEDHHELCAMVAPRALFVLGNPDFVWLADPSGYVSCRATQKVYETLGISDRFGFSIVGGHNHCAMPSSQVPEVTAFVKKFLLGDTTVNTIIRTNPYPNIDYNRWMAWWGTNTAVFPSWDVNGNESHWLEAECATVGKNWKITPLTASSNRAFAQANSGLTLSTTTAPTDSASSIYLPFTVKKDTTYNLFLRVYGSASSNSFWVKMDDGSFKLADSLNTTGLEWRLVAKYNLKPGDHKLTVALSESGDYLDKILISSNSYFPVLNGDTAQNVCVPQITKVEVNSIKAVDGYSLGQNYPNPFNGKTNISFQIPKDNYVSLRVYNELGVEIAELAGKKYSKGEYVVEFNVKNISKGIYYYTINSDNFSSSRKMVLQGD